MSRMTLARDNAPGEYFHIFNRGAHRQGIFKERADWLRFLFGVLYYQSPIQFPHVGRYTSTFESQFGFDVSDKIFQNVLNKRAVELVCFCLMSNHFHLLVKETTESGIANYMQRLLVAYTMYFNTRYESSGHVFQGRYKAVHIESDKQLMYLSAYIHRNPRELSEWKGKEAESPWSSLHDYVKENRWGGLIVPEIILGQFEGTEKSNYADFVKTSTAKLLAEELGELRN